METVRKSLLAGIPALALAACAAAAEPGFAEKPAARPDEGKWVVTFSVTAPTDVAVTVRDESGRPIRHLAAGALGPKAPAPLAANSLKQRLTWDGADDDGRPVRPGAYRIDVALGLRVRRDAILGYNPKFVNEVHGLATGPDGALYVLSALGRDTQEPRFQIFTAAGDYVRTMVPRPGNMPAERVKPFNEVALPDGTRVPREMLPFYEWRSRQQPLVMPGGDLIFVTSRMYSEVGNGARFTKRLLGPKGLKAPFERRLLRLAADGGAPLETDYVGPSLGTNMPGLICLAASPDHKTIYVSGSRHAVFTTTWDRAAKLTPLIGTPDRPGAGKAGLKNPVGIDTDADGAIYVADRGNHRIAFFSPRGAYVGQLDVEWPDQVRVRPDGALFVVAGAKDRSLLKFASRAATDPSARLRLGPGQPFIALDRSAKGRTGLFVANVHANAANRGGRLVRLDDRPEGFVEAATIGVGGRLMQPMMIGVDRTRELIYAKRGIFADYIQFDGQSETSQRFPLPLDPKSNGIHEMTAGADGTIVAHVANEFGKLDWTLKPLPFVGLGSYLTYYPDEDGPRSNYAKDCTVAPNGDIYWLHERGGYRKPMVCSVIGLDGREKKRTLITFEDCSAAGIRVDRRGCVYTMNHVKPVGKLVPDVLAGKTGTNRADPYVYRYGSVLKFRPTGGAVRLVAPGRVKKRDVPAGRFQVTTAEGRGDFVTEGVEWLFFGVSNILPNYQRDGCHCWSPRFDVDDFGRVFVPDQMLNRIHVLDTNGNLLTTFGRYGNVDQAGKGDAVVLGDPRTVVASDEAAYVGDMSNNCIVRARLDYAATESAGLTVSRKAPDLVKAVAEVRAEAVGLVPATAKAIDWDRINHDAPAAVSADDVRAAVALATRQAVLDESDRATLLARYAASTSPALRATVVLANWQRDDRSAVQLLTAALKDDDAMVRVAAADTLLSMNNGAGFAEILRALTSDNRNVFRLAETAFTKKVMEGGASRYPITPEVVEALGNLLAETSLPDRRRTDSFWYMRRTAIWLLSQSGNPAAVDPLIALVKFDGSRYGGRRNMCRAIDGLGRLRARKAVPMLVTFVARGTIKTNNSNFGDTAERNAAAALAAIGDPDAVTPLIDLTTSDKKNTARLALRAVSQMFSAAPLPPERVLLPEGGRLVSRRTDELPAPADVRKAWQAFWAGNRTKYRWNPDDPALAPSAP